MSMLGKNQALGVDIVDDAIRIVALRAAGAKYEVTHAARYPLQREQSNAATAEMLARLFAETGAARYRVAGGIAASGCAFKTASLPTAKPAELAQVITFEAETQFPLPLQEMVWGYTLTPEAAGRTRAVIVGARSTLVEERLAMLQQSGVSPVVMLPTPLAAAESVTHPTGLYVLVVAGAQWTDLCLYDGEDLLACRSVLAGSPGADGWAQRIAREARPWFAGNDRPQSMLLLGQVLPETAEALRRAADLSVTLGDPWDDIRDVNSCQTQLDGSPSSYATAIGLAKIALRKQPALNLLPARITETSVQLRKLAWSIIGLLLLAIILIPAVLTSAQVQRERQAAYAQVEKQVRQVRKKMPTLPTTGVTTAQQVLTTLNAPASQPFDILYQLSDVLPEKVQLSDLSYDRGKGTVILKGRADAHATVATAMRAMTDLAMVERAMIDYATASNIETEPGYDFQITCILRATDDPTMLTGRARGSAKARTERNSQ